MEFSGDFELKGVSPEEAWLVLSDPVAIRNALPGCKYLVKVDPEGDVDFDALEESQPEESDDRTYPQVDREVVEQRGFKQGERYAAVMSIGVGAIKPTFRSTVSIDAKEFPEMQASGRGSGGGSSFEMDSGMTIEETAEGSVVHWSASSNISGKIASLGQRLLNPVANRVVKNFFNAIEDQMQE